jgi:hypothetical protein
METLIALALYFGVASATLGEVFTKVYLADGKTPLELADPNIPLLLLYRDVMAGTRLTIIVSSDSGGYWGGDLAMTGEDRNYGLLSARDYSETTHDWAGSRLPAAGNMARVWEWQEPDIQGFNLEGHRSSVAGDWFIIDYTATSVGVCNVGFYDYNVSWVDPIYYLTFFHVPTRDFNSDTKVDFADFAIFASCWQGVVCAGPDWCKGDLDMDGWVDLNDLILFADFWLEKTQ